MQLQITRGQSLYDDDSYTPKGLEDHQPLYEVTYRHCGVTWEGTWDCGCDDECPNCGKDIEAAESELIREPGYTVLYREKDAKPTDLPKAYQCRAEDEFFAEGECLMELGESRIAVLFVAHTFDVKVAYQEYQDSLKATA